ncbi:MAG: ABC transporter permease, partial [Candidatus Onthovivens sp.]|nr:ABC transporter permease [Candidatus Onthovivens sp.]
SLVFSVFLSISYIYNGLFEAIFGISLTAENGVTPELFKILPFIASLILLIFTSKKSRAPKAEGVPFDVSKR